MRLIDADALLAQIMAAKQADPAISDVYGEEYEAVSAWLSAAPTVDAVEVVRCEDCSMCEIVEYYGGGEKRVCRIFKRSMQPDDFCSCGERKGGDK